MSFYVMKQDTLIQGSVALDGVPDFIDPSDWIAGKVMPAPQADLVLPLSLESGKYFGSIINSFLPLFHKSLKNCLDKFGVDNIQYYPVDLIDQNGLVPNEKLAGVYYLANIIGRLDCVDLQKSQVEYWPSGYGFDFLSMSIDEQKTNGEKIFRIKDNATLIIINEELKQYLVDELNVLVGVELIKTEDYSTW
jgi:hypothetical protein